MHDCKACGSQNTKSHTECESVRYKGTTLTVPMSYLLCGNCGHEFVPAAVIKQNDKAVRIAKRHHNGLLSPEDIQTCRKKLGLSQEEAARVFGGGPHAFSKYERGEVTQSAAMDRLIRLCLKHPELLDELRSGFTSTCSLKKVEDVREAVLSDWHTETYTTNDPVYMPGTTTQRSLEAVEISYGS